MTCLYDFFLKNIYNYCNDVVILHKCISNDSLFLLYYVLEQRYGVTLLSFYFFY